MNVIGAFDWFAIGLTQLLNNQHEADNTYLPGSRKKLYCYEEAFVVIWKLMDDNEVYATFHLFYSVIMLLMMMLTKCVCMVI
jgi:hypothetical protein